MSIEIILLKNLSIDLYIPIQLVIKFLDRDLNQISESLSYAHQLTITCQFVTKILLKMFSRDETKVL